jgi:hypothetical protein
METQRIEYIRKNGRKKGHKKGVLFCGIDPDDDQSVIIGFTLCHAIDRFDYIKEQRVEGFGLETAKLRAEKWKFHTDYFLQKTWKENELDDEDVLIYIYKNPDNQSIVEVPPSVMVRLKPFIERCRKYYKDKDFPMWIQKIEQGQPYSEKQLPWIKYALWKGELS